MAGSPVPAETTTSGGDPLLEPGWRPDPTGRYDFRYWDGAWTNRVASAARTTEDELVASPHGSTAAGASTGSDAADVTDSSAPTGDVHTGLTDVAPRPAAPEAGGRRRSPLRAVWGGVGRFFRSFADEPESYHSPAAVPIQEVRRSTSVLDGSPLPYGRAALVCLAACAIAAGASLPWLSGTISGVGFQQSGFEAGDGWLFLSGALLLAVAALLGVRFVLVRWLTIVLSLAAAGLVIREVAHTNDAVTAMNASPAVRANIGTGLWVMAAAALVAVVASFRLGDTT